MLFAGLRGRLSFGLIREACLRTALTSSMIFVILLGASVFSLVFRGLGGEALVEEALRAMPGGATWAMAVFMAVMFLLGFFLDTFEIIFIMVPVFGPPLILLGCDPLWLGVMVAINLQTSSSPRPSAPRCSTCAAPPRPRSAPRTSGSGSITPTMAAARRVGAGVGVPAAGDVAAEGDLRENAARRVAACRPGDIGEETPMPAAMDASADAGADAGHAQATARPGFWALALGSVGVVYGDIGTSPLYALREALNQASGRRLLVRARR